MCWASEQSHLQWTVHSTSRRGFPGEVLEWTFASQLTRSVGKQTAFYVNYKVITHTKRLTNLNSFHGIQAVLSCSDMPFLTSQGEKCHAFTCRCMTRFWEEQTTSNCTHDTHKHSFKSRIWLKPRPDASWAVAKASLRAYLEHFINNWVGLGVLFCDSKSNLQNIRRRI